MAARYCSTAPAALPSATQSTARSNSSSFVAMAEAYRIPPWAGNLHLAPGLPGRYRRRCRATPGPVQETTVMLLSDELAGAMTASERGDAAFEFESWALRVFRHQYERNVPYRTFCDRRGVGPSHVARWQDVPAVPTAAFRHADLACGPAELVFRTSGTTAGPDARGRHPVAHPALSRTPAL